jgi:hypothetical protein
MHVEKYVKSFVIIKTKDVIRRGKITKSAIHCEQEKAKPQRSGRISLLPWCRTLLANLYVSTVLG